MLLADMYRRRPFAPYPYSLVLVPTFVCLYPCLAGTVSHSSIDVDDSLQKILTLNCRLSPVNCIRVLSELFSCLGTLTHRLPSFCIADRQVTSELLPKKVAEHIPALFYVVYWHLISDRPSLVLSEVLGYVQTFLFEAFDRSCKGVSWFPIVLAMISQLRTLVDLRLLWVSGRRSVQHALNLSNGFEPDFSKSSYRFGCCATPFVWEAKMRQLRYCSRTRATTPGDDKQTRRQAPRPTYRERRPRQYTK